jgi:cleavage and polyadenylation specificity factor subunit 1
MHPADIRKTAICTPFGLFEFRRMPFGLRNAGNTFQRMMDGILAGLSFVFCYLDDIIIASKDEQEHLEHLREVFSRLREAGLVINAEKCVFAVTRCQPPAPSLCAATCRRCSPTQSRPTSTSCRLS